MAKFKYYITDIINGEVVGTDDRDLATNYAESEDFFVVDAEAGQWIQTDGEVVDVESARDIEEEEDRASSNTSCTEITEEEYDAAQQAQRA